MDFEDKKLQVTVETEQQSLAIGKRGQNVRLAARLVGWDIDIRSEEDMKREIAQQMEDMLTAEVVPVTFIEGITPQDSAILAEHGIETIEQLAAAEVDDLCDWLDLSVDDAEEQLAMVREIVAVREAALAQHDASAPEETPATAEETPEAEEAITEVEATSGVETTSEEAQIEEPATPTEADEPADASSPEVSAESAVEEEPDQQEAESQT